MTTETRDFASLPAGFAPARGLATLAGAAGRRILAWDARYRERCRLAELSNETLRDIGASRGDAVLEARKPFWRE